jgi:hypothetical protein
MDLSVKGADYFVGSHHCGFVPIGLPDDGFGNAVFRESKVFGSVVGAGSSQKLYFILETHQVH